MTRTPEQERHMKQLLSVVTGEVLGTPEGKIIRQSLTAEEEQALRDVAVMSDYPPGLNYDMACDMCRGFCRLTQCPVCRGFFTNAKEWFKEKGDRITSIISPPEDGRDPS